MGWLTDALTDWLKQGLIEAVMERMQNMFESINSQVGEIATNVGKTPQDWNSSIFSMIRTLSDTAILPIAGMILTFVLCYELIHMIMERNNMHEVVLCR
jgi:Mg2+ and Co2+ transporter CorA